MEALANEHEGVRLRIVDIASWGSEVARQYRIESLPALWLYEDGELRTKERAEVLARLHALR